MKYLVVAVSGVFWLLTLSNALECYVCHNQEDNSEKCKKTLKTCEHYEDMCLTNISWGTMPYWQTGGQKQFYISKSCATAQQCNRTINRLMNTCTHIWYEDWRCAECCQGDRCNYYIISKSENLVSSCLGVLAAVAVLTFF